MSKPLKPRRGTTAEHANFIGQAHEVTYDTDKHTLVMHDGVTPGGFPLARADEVAAKDETQDAKIAEAKSSADAASEDVTALDTALRQLIAEELAKYLPLSGGTMTGEIKRNGDLARTTSPQSDLYLLAGEGYERIAGLMLRGYNANNYPGYAQLMAGDSVETAQLNLAPTGRLTVNGNAVATVPNWSGIISKSVNVDHTAEVDGYILFASSNYGYPNSDMKSFIKINDVQYQVSAEFGAAAVFQALCLPLAKGDKYTFYPGRTGNGEYLYFLPLKGAV